MRRLAAPLLDAAEVYSSCVEGVSDAGLTARFHAAAADMSAYAAQYRTRATSNDLHLFVPSDWARPEQVVLRDLTKGEFTKLYTDNMVDRKKAGRTHYDRLLATAPHGKCPFCGFGHVSTLDHFMSKSRYPLFSILPDNLVPACTDCNKDKGAGILDGENQMPHPYFEVDNIETDTWLFATIEETLPATVTYHVSAPDHWQAPLTRRVLNYFHDLDLASRFSVQAASEMVELSDYLGYLDAGQMAQHLNWTAQSERANRRNSWKAALYECLANSAWYQLGGYRRAR